MLSGHRVQASEKWGVREKAGYANLELYQRSAKGQEAKLRRKIKKENQGNSGE